MSLTQEKIANPLNFYQSPKDVDSDASLSTLEKTKILTNWLNDIELRETAESENMRSIRPLNNQQVAIIEQLLNKYKPM